MVDKDIYANALNTLYETRKIYEDKLESVITCIRGEMSDSDINDLNRTMISYESYISMLDELSYKIKKRYKNKGIHMSYYYKEARHL